VRGVCVAPNFFWLDGSAAPLLFQSDAGRGRKAPGWKFRGAVRTIAVRAQHAACAGHGPFSPSRRRSPRTGRRPRGRARPHARSRPHVPPRADNGRAGRARGAGGVAAELTAAWQPPPKVGMGRARKAGRGRWRCQSRAHSVRARARGRAIKACDRVKRTVQGGARTGEGGLHDGCGGSGAEGWPGAKKGTSEGEEEEEAAGALSFLLSALTKPQTHHLHTMALITGVGDAFGPALNPVEAFLSALAAPTAPQARLVAMDVHEVE